MVCGCAGDIPVGYDVACGVLKDGQTVIDGGCANGSGIISTKEHLAARGIQVKVIGIDRYSPEEMYGDEYYEQNPAEQHQRIRDAKANHAKMEFVHGVIDEVRDLEADVVTCFGLACETSQRQAALRRLAGFLKPDGVMVLGVYHVGFRCRMLDHVKFDILERPFSRLRQWVLGRRRLRRFFACIEIKVMTKAEAAEHAETCAGRHFTEGFGCGHGRVAGVS